MVAMINGWTRTSMWVADDRVNEYLEAGHVLASSVAPEKPAEEVKEEPKEESKKAVRKKK